MNRIWPGPGRWLQPPAGANYTGYLPSVGATSWPKNKPFPEQSPVLDCGLLQDFWPVPGQDLALLSIGIEQLIQKAPESQAQLNEQLQKLSTRTKELSSKVQTLSHQLHPSQLVHLGLVAASRSLCHEVSQSSDIQIDFSHSDVSRSISPEVSTCLYRVLQESLTNVVKHSGAKTAQVELAGSPSEIQLQILDSGVGFDPKSTGSRGGLGLIGMRERLSLLGGELLIESRPSGNTWIKACLPLNSSASPD